VKQSDELIRKLTGFMTSQNKKTGFTNENEAFDAKKGVSIYMKIMLNYIQSIAIIQSLELKWPFYVESYLNTYSTAGSVSTQTISLDCMINDYQIDIQAIYLETLFSSFLPFFCFFCSGIALASVYFVKKKSQKIRFIVIVIVGSIFLQPMIIKILFKNLVCKKINNKSYLVQNLKIDCDSDSHLNW
jgi:hypothetical protein